MILVYLDNIAWFLLWFSCIATHLSTNHSLYGSAFRSS